MVGGQTKEAAGGALDNLAVIFDQVDKVDNLPSLNSGPL